jgi:hypothetical protein
VSKSSPTCTCTTRSASRDPARRAARTSKWFSPSCSDGAGRGVPEITFETLRASSVAIAVCTSPMRSRPGFDGTSDDTRRATVAHLGVESRRLQAVAFVIDAANESAPASIGDGPGPIATAAIGSARPTARSR